MAKVRMRVRGLLCLVALATVGASGVFAATSEAATVNSVPPTVTGTPTQGQTLTSSTGTWSGTGTITYSYRWQRCNPDGSACADIAGAVANTYVLGSADVGNAVRSVVTATDPTPSANDAPSAVTAAISARTTAAPAATTPPSISGTPIAGQTLTAVEGVYTGAAPIAFTYQWYRCDSIGNACAAIVTATGKSYLLVAADIGAALRVVVAATNASGSASAATVPTAIIAVGVPADAITLPGGTMSVEAADVTGAVRLTLDHFKVSTSQPIHTRSAFKITFHVSDTRGYSVRNALVYLVGLPYNRIGKISEHKTLMDGTVTFTIVPTKLQPLKTGARLVIFARARVQGDSLLTGASTRRLIEVVFGAPAG